MNIFIVLMFGFLLVLILGMLSRFTNEINLMKKRLDVQTHWLNHSLPASFILDGKRYFLLYENMIRPICAECARRDHVNCSGRDCTCAVIYHDDSDWWIPVEKIADGLK